MGLYIDHWIDGSRPPTKGKTDWLVSKGAVLLDASEYKPPQWSRHLVCVVTNPTFDAAAWCFSPEEFRDFVQPDGRKKRWLIVDEVEQIFPRAWKDFFGEE